MAKHRCPACTPCFRRNETCSWCASYVPVSEILHVRSSVGASMKFAIRLRVLMTAVRESLPWWYRWVTRWPFK